MLGMTMTHFITTFLSILCVIPFTTYARLHTPPQQEQHQEEQTTNEIPPLSNPISNPDDEAISSLTTSSNIPSVEDTIELSHLSGFVYNFASIHATNCSSFANVIDYYVEKNGPDSFIANNGVDVTYTCHLYERAEQDTQVLVLSRLKNTVERGGDVDADADASISSSSSSITTSSSSSTTRKRRTDPIDDYIAIIYAGTDDFRTALTDSNIRTKQFGPPGENNTYPLSPSTDIRVHAGFDNAVFQNGLFDRIQSLVLDLKHTYPHLRLLSTGHSLGGANAILTSVALKQYPPFNSEETIHSITFGCPKTGNRHFKEWVNSIPGLGLWRVVNRYDLVPRLPDFRFVHVGHTLQLYMRSARAYWLHEGDVVLGFRGVPFDWAAMSFALAPAAAVEHMLSHYVHYLIDKSQVNEDRYYVSFFETKSSQKVQTQDDDESSEWKDDDDDYHHYEEEWDRSDPNKMEEYISRYSQEYVRLVTAERSVLPPPSLPLLLLLDQEERQRTVSSSS